MIMNQHKWLHYDNDDDVEPLTGTWRHHIPETPFCDQDAALFLTAARLSAERTYSRTADSSRPASRATDRHVSSCRSSASVKHR